MCSAIWVGSGGNRWLLALEKVGWVGGLQIGRALSGLRGHLPGPFPASAAPEPPAWPLGRGDRLVLALESAEKRRRGRVWGVLSQGARGLGFQNDPPNGEERVCKGSMSGVG